MARRESRTICSVLCGEGGKIRIYWNTVMVKNKSDIPSEAADRVDDAGAGLPQDFETALSQLESLVAKMESGTLPLDESLAVYEKGVELARICQRRLDHAEQQVKVLQGNLLRPLDAASDEAGQ